MFPARNVGFPFSNQEQEAACQGARIMHFASETNRKEKQLTV